MQRFVAAILLLTSTVGSIVLLVLLGNVLLGVYVSKRPLIPDARVTLPVYDGFSWAHQYGLDQAAHYRESEKKLKPYTLWKRGLFASTYVNIDSTDLRVTPKRPLPDARRVFVFGGSTVWGTGSPDSLTIPAQLQQLLGPGYDVFNYGEAAYVHAQCQQQLLELLSQDIVPDVAVFVDGANDIYTGVYSPGIARHPHQLGNPLAERIKGLPGLSNYSLLLERFSGIGKGGMRESAAYDALCRPHIRERAARTVDTYLNMTRQTSAIANTLGIEAHFFWQPAMLAGTRDLMPYENDLMQGYSPVMMEAFITTYKVAEQRITATTDDNVHFIGHAFDTVAQPIYIDWCHTGPQGNAVIAAIIARKILE
jgi:lysophospholipase L1-like esterase